MARTFAKSNRFKAWSGATASGQVTVVATPKVIITSTTTSGVAATLLRTRGEILITAAPNAATDSDVIGLGIIVIKQAAAVVGGASVPSPVDDLTASWLWHRFLCMDAAGATAQSDASISNNVRVEVDSKAMRKMTPQDAIVLIAQAADGDFSVVNIQAALRFLQAR